MMKRRLMTLAVMVVLCAIAAFATGCGENHENKAIANAEKTIDSQLELLERVEPIPKMLDSANRHIQAYFYTAEADPNKTWYLETLSMSGSVEATYTIKGPVVPAGDEVSNPEQIACKHFPHQDGEGGCEPGVIALAEPNGIYQHDTNDHLAILESGALLRFEGQYQVSDQPFTVKTPTTIAIDGSAPISKTDLTKTEKGVIPTRH